MKKCSVCTPGLAEVDVRARAIHQSSTAFLRVSLLEVRNAGDHYESTEPAIDAHTLAIVQVHNNHRMRVVSGEAVLLVVEDLSGERRNTSFTIELTVKAIFYI